MKRTTISLDPEVGRELKRVGVRRGVTFATIIREAMAAYLVKPPGGTLPSIAGRFSSGRTDTSERSEELLWKDPHV